MVKKINQDRFWLNVRPEGTCWVWTGVRDKDGYGQFVVNGKNQRAHRIAWAEVNGPIPDGMLICHTCDNPPCVEVSHLFMGTCKDNLHDAALKGRMPGAYDDRKVILSELLQGNQYAKGYHHTDETKAKISLAGKGHPVSEKSREAARINMTKYNESRKNKEVT